MWNFRQGQLLSILFDAVIFISPFSKSPCYFKRQYRAKDNMLHSGSQKKGYPLMSNVSAARSNLNVLIP